MGIPGVSAGTIKEMALDSGFDLVGIVDSNQIGADTDLSKTIVLALVTPDRSAEFVYKVEISGQVRWSKWIYERLQNSARKLTMALREMGFRLNRWSLRSPGRR